MLDYDREERLFLERIEDGFYVVDRAGNCGDDYVESGRLDRDTEALGFYVNSDDFSAIRELR